MRASTIYIKNMVCSKCITSVEQIFTGLNIRYNKVGLGVAEVAHPLEELERIALMNELFVVGFELLEANRARDIEIVKTLVNRIILDSNREIITKPYTEYISSEIGKDYDYLNSLFAETECMSIERYIILQKIEKVKELISYNRLNLQEIASRLNYTSVTHLSTQFKKSTGLSTEQFRRMKMKNSRNYNDITIP